MKYYVQTGDIKMIIDRPSPYEAAFYGIRKALLDDKEEKKTLGIITFVGESGFIDDVDEPKTNMDDRFILTERILTDLGIGDYFHIPEDKMQALIKQLNESQDIDLEDMLEELGEEDNGWGFDDIDRKSRELDDEDE